MVQIRWRLGGDNLPCCCRIPILEPGKPLGKFDNSCGNLNSAVFGNTASDDGGSASSVDEAIRAADHLMYQVKGQGKGMRWRFDTKIMRIELERHFHPAQQLWRCPMAPVSFLAMPIFHPLCRTLSMSMCGVRQKSRAGSATRYPVVYMRRTESVRSGPILHRCRWGMDETMVRLICETGRPGAIIVGIWNSPLRLRAMPQKPLNASGGSASEPVCRADRGSAAVGRVFAISGRGTQTVHRRPLSDFVGPAHTLVMGSAWAG